MDIELLFSLTPLIAYVILRVFSWCGTTETKSAFWTRDLIQTNQKSK